MRFIQFDFTELRDDSRFGDAVHWFQRQPSWVWRVAMLATMLLVLLPILLVIIVFTAVFAVLFGVLWVVATITAGAKRLLGLSDDGRRNVRVVQRES